MNGMEVKEIKEEKNWTSKKELMEICKCSKTTLEQIINNLSCQTGLATQSHIKKGGYHNSETYYDEELVKLIQAKLLSNQANQGRYSEVVKHRISFKTVAAEAGLVKETDYAERIYGEDCFPTTMISESGIDKIYNCFDR